MVFSYYLTKPLYCFTWHVLKAFRKEKKCVLYCEDAFDVMLFSNVQKYLKHIKIVAKNGRVRAILKSLGIRAGRLPIFPDVVIMFRNASWKFPCKEIITIGFEHGAYNFKRFSKASYYNLFKVFFMTSSADVARAEKLGIKTAKAIGFPKIDNAFNGELEPGRIHDLENKLGLNRNKKTLLFSSTWDGSGMSAIHLWYNRLDSLRDQFNVLVTTHAWMSEKYRGVLEHTQGIIFITDYEVLPYIKIADVCIGDCNSLLAEFCLLNKPIITFRVPPTSRTMPDVMAIIEEISCRINTFEEIAPAVETLLANKTVLFPKQQEAVKTFFDQPDGKAGYRAAVEIGRIVPELRLAS